MRLHMRLCAYVYVQAQVLVCACAYVYVQAQVLVCAYA